MKNVDDVTTNLPTAMYDKEDGSGKITSCFICDDKFEDSGSIPLSVGCTSYSKTRLPTKIGQLMGDDIMVVIARDDVLCKRCTTLLNRLDKLENDMGVVQKALRGYLNRKYKLVDIKDEEDFQQDGDDSTSIAEVPSPVPKSVSPPINSTRVNGECRAMKKCVTCDFETTFPGVLKSHQSRCRSRQLSYRCSMCDKKFLSAKHVRQHVMAAHLSNWPCHYCGANFSEETDYTSHMKTHITTLIPQAQESLACESCDFTTTDPKLLEEHAECHRSRLFTCDECGQSFEDEESCVLHVNQHGQVEVPDSLACNLCSSTFEHSDEVNNHLLTCHMSEHLGTVRVELEEGDYEMKSLETLDGSLPSVVDAGMVGASILPQNLNIEYYFCNLCSLAFENLTLFFEHNKSHSDDQHIDLPLCKGEIDCDYQQYSEINEHLEEILLTIHSNNTEESEKTGGETDDDTRPFVSCDVQADQQPGFRFDSDTVENCDNERTGLFDFITEQHDDTAKMFATNEITTLEENVGDDSGDPDRQPENQSCDIFEMVRLKKLSSVTLNVKEMPLLLGTFNKYQISSSVNSGGEPNTSSYWSEDGSDDKVVSDTKTSYVCAVCSYETRSTADLFRHRKEHESGEEFPRPTCKVELSNQEDLDNHSKTHQVLTESFKCQYCLLDFADKYSLHDHILVSHPNERQVYTCMFCLKTLPSKKALRNHEESHSDRPNRRFSCDACNETFQREKQLKNHLSLMHRDPHCRFCGKEILKAKTLKFHELRHVKNKGSYDCEVCSRTFKTRTGLIHHQATHTGDYKYRCSFCGHGFMSRMMMEEHRSKHTKEERYVCDICGKKFNFQSTYWIHRKWHDTPYPYKCNYCDRLFRHSSLLAVHKRKHTGERPYKCPHCPMAFTVSGTLKRHTILHTGKYPHTCDLCKRGFTTKHKYACHLAKVHGDGEMLRAQGQPCQYKMVLGERGEEEVVAEEESQPVAVTTLDEASILSGDLWSYQ